MIKLKARRSVPSIGWRRRPSGAQRAALRPQRFMPTSPAVRVPLVALGLGGSAGAVLLQRRRTRVQRRSRLARVAARIPQRPLLAPSLVAGAGALAGAYLFLRRRRAARRVRSAMTLNPRTVEPSMLLSEAAQLMKREDVGSLPVVENERLVGMLTDRDIVTRAVAEGVDTGACRVGDVASRELVTVEPEQDLNEALLLMARHKVRRLPVVEGERLVGILGQADVALEARDKKVGEVLEGISKPTSAGAPRE
jgi:CBS domain-containing protein